MNYNPVPYTNQVLMQYVSDKYFLIKPKEKELVGILGSIESAIDAAAAKDSQAEIAFDMSKATRPSEIEVRLIARIARKSIIEKKMKFSLVNMHHYAKNFITNYTEKILKIKNFHLAVPMYESIKKYEQEKGHEQEKRVVSATNSALEKEIDEIMGK
jgi:hypothetical protein